MHESIYDRYCYIRDKKNLRDSDVAKGAKVTKSTFSDWKAGRYVPKHEKLKKIADFLNVSIEYLSTGEEKKKEYDNISNIYKVEKRILPMLGEIACGEPKYTNEDRESYIMAGTNIDADFCLKAKGDSMVNARILDGDIVFIKQQDIVENGEIAAVVVNNDSEATLKRFFYYQEKSLLILKPENPAYEDQIYQGEELNQVHVLGKAIAFQSDVK